MTTNKGLLSNLYNDELRNMVIDANNSFDNNSILNENYNNSILNNNYDNKYNSFLNRPQTIKENLGIIFNDDSTAQQTISSNNITNKELKELDYEFRYLIISGEDRPWHLLNSLENTFNFHIDCGDISLINDNQSTSANVKHSLENVVSVYCSGVIIPNRLLEDNTRPTDVPYLQLSINNIENTSFGTNRSLDTTLAILTPKIPLPNTLQDIPYLEFINTNQQTKIYNTPKLRLNKLNLSLRRYDGYELLETDLLNYRDVLDIKSIYFNSNNNKLFLESLTYFNTNNFKVGDIIKCKNYNFRETNLDFPECHTFNTFINNTRGHRILSTSSSIINDDIIYHNIIEIEYPRSVNILTGKYEIKSWFQNLLNKTSLDSNLENDNTGRLINSSLQIQVLLKFNVINKNSSRLIKTNIDI